MKDFKKFGGNRDRGGFGGRDGGRPSFGGGNGGFKKFGDRGSDRPVTLHKAVCADCGKGCEVPFRPNGEKPVFCNECFGGKKESPMGGRDNGRPSFDNRFEKRDFGGSAHVARPERTNDARPDRRIDDLKMQMDKLNAKLDKMMDMMKAQPSVSTSKQAPVVEVKKAPVVEAKKSAPKAAPKKVEAKSAKKVAKKKTVAKKK